MLLLVALWAFAEAILLFIVADVPISYVAVRHGIRRGCLAALIGAFAATAGGAVAYGWARADPPGFRELMIALPALDAAVIDANARKLAEQGSAAMLAGSLSGVPYKIYAFSAAEQGRALLPFLLVSPLVRLPRFLLSALAAGLIAKLLSRRLSLRARLAVLGLVWIVFYLFYFVAAAG